MRKSTSCIFFSILSDLKTFNFRKGVAMVLLPVPMNLFNPDYVVSLSRLKVTLPEFSKYFSRFPMSFPNSRENLTSLPKHSILGLSPPVVSASICVFVVSAPPLRDFNKEPTNYLSSDANADIDDSTCNHKQTKLSKSHAVTLFYK